MSEVNTGTANENENENENEQQESQQTPARMGYNPNLRWGEADPIYADKMNNMIDGIDQAINTLSTKLDKPENIGTSGQVLTINGSGQTSWDNVINQIPTAGANQFGKVKIDSSKGINIDNGTLTINPATKNDINAGVNATKPIVPSTLVNAVHKGLAALADSNLTYNDTYKQKIREKIEAYNKPQAGIPLSDLDATDGNSNMYLSYDNTNKVGWSELPFALNTADVQIPDPTSPKIISNATQDKSVFYGLASAAGDTSQAQIEIGNDHPYTYTNNAKRAICNLLDARSKQDSTIAYVAPTTTSREYTDFVFGNDNNPGTLTAPFATIAKALEDPTIETIIVTPGDYYESVIIKNRKIQIICLSRQYHYTTTNEQGNEVTVSEYLYDAIFHHPARKELTDEGYIDRYVGAMGIFLLQNCIFELDHIQAWGNARYNGGHGFYITESTGTLRNCVASNNEQNGYYFIRCDIACYNCISYSNGTRIRTLKAPTTIVIDDVTYTIQIEYTENEAGSQTYPNETNGARFGFRTTNSSVIYYNCSAYNNPMTGYRFSDAFNKTILINCTSHHNNGYGIWNVGGIINIYNGEYYLNTYDGILITRDSQGQINGIYAHDNNSESSNSYAGIRIDYNSDTVITTLPMVILNNNIIENNYRGIVINKYKAILSSNVFVGQDSDKNIIYNNSVSQVKQYNSIIVPET